MNTAHYNGNNINGNTLERSTNTENVTTHFAATASRLLNDMGGHVFHMMSSLSF